MSFSEFRSVLLGADVISIGEAPYTPSHIEAALQVLQTLLDEGRTPILGMEMFSWDGQGGLDRSLNGDVTRNEEFLAESQWKNNWGGKYADYSQLVDFAKTHDLKLLGLTPPLPIVRKVVPKGLRGLGGATMGQKVTLPDAFPERENLVYVPRTFRF